MTVHVLSAAKHMGQKSSWSLSNLAMQKLLYLAHMYHLGEHDSPLAPPSFEAWEYGPVHPTLYHAAKVFGSDPVKNIFRSYPDVEEGTEQYALDECVNMGLPTSRLVAITHWEDGAWYQHYIPGQRGIIIPDDDIRVEYQERVERVRKKIQAPAG